MHQAPRSTGGWWLITYGKGDGRGVYQKADFGAMPVGGGGRKVGRGRWLGGDAPGDARPLTPVRLSSPKSGPSPAAALVSTQVTELERAVKKIDSFPLDGGRLGWGWERQSTFAPPPRPSPTTGGGRIY